MRTSLSIGHCSWVVVLDWKGIRVVRRTTLRYIYVHFKVINSSESSIFVFLFGYWDFQISSLFNSDADDRYSIVQY